MTDAHPDEPHWTTIGERVVLDGRARMVVRTAILPDGSQTDYVMNDGGAGDGYAVASLLVVDGDVLLSRQYRYPIDQWIYDLPAGGADGSEEPEAAARREVEEELGLVPTDLRPLHTFFPNPGLSTWPVRIFFGTRVEPGTPSTDDASEQVRLARMPLAELDARIADGRIVDPSVLVARTMAAARGWLPPVGVPVVRPAATSSVDADADRPRWSVYDDMAEGYERHSAASAYNAHYDRPAMLATIGEVAGLDVLDAASGAGHYTRALLDRGARVTAFDASAELVRIAREGYGDRARIDRADFDGPLPYPDASFDLVVCALAIHYASDRAATLREFARVLRPGGRCVLSTQHPTTDWMRKGGSYFDTALETDVWTREGRRHAVRFWREPLGATTAAATDAGFLIAGLVEPLPDDVMRELSPEDDAVLRRQPGFLILDLVKPAG